GSIKFNITSEVNMKISLTNHTKTILKPLEDISSEFNLDITEINTHTIDESLKTITPDLAIINWIDNMAEETDAVIKKFKATKKPPFILLLGTKEITQGLMSGISSGADDYLLMPFTKGELKLKFNVIKKNINTNNALIKTKRKLIKYAKEDPVTSVLNRRALLDEMLSEMGRAARRGDFICSIMINLHNYNELLEQLGIKVFDIFLGEFSAKLKKSIRPYDKIGRFDLSRFIIFLPQARNADAEKVAERIIKNIQSKKFKFNDYYIEPVVSIGISELDPDDMQKNDKLDDHAINDLILESFIKRSEFATSTADEKGENKIEVYTF
ncbi:MAG: diguanylate cyclase, partial [Leptospirales bacterium]|nr:diguanylate cyclase [Leptospirales bacterium]